MGDECRVMVVGAIEVHGCGPRHIGDVQALLIERNPFEEHIAGGALHPYIGFKGVCAVPKAGEDAANAGSVPVSRCSWVMEAASANAKVLARIAGSA